LVDCSGKCNDGIDCGCTQGKDRFGHRHEEVECEECTTTCQGGVCSTTCEPSDPETVTIYQCNCMCYPQKKLRDDVLEPLKTIRDAIKDRIEQLRTQETELKNRADAVETSNKKLSDIDSLKNNPVTGYDAPSLKRSIIF
jgi:hypothetical protein